MSDNLKWDSEKGRFVEKEYKTNNTKYKHYSNGRYKYSDEALGGALMFMLGAGIIAWIVSLIFR